MSSYIYWAKKIICLILVISLMGCQTTPYKEESIHHMEDILQAGSDEDHAIRNAHGAKLPTEIKKALLCPNPEEQKALSKMEVRYDINAEQVPAKAFFLSLVQDTPFNITMHPNVAGFITLHLKKVSIPEVLETVKNVYGYNFQRSAHGIEILPAALQTKTFHVDYLDVARGGKSETIVSSNVLSSSSTSSTYGANTSSTVSGGAGNDLAPPKSKVSTKTSTDFWLELKLTIESIVGVGEGRRVAVSPMSSVVIVQALPEELRKVEDFLRSADLSLKRQVILEAKIFEVVLNDSYQAGVNWEVVSGQLRAAQFGGNVVENILRPGDDFPVLSTDLSGRPVNITPGTPSFNPGQAINAFGGVFALAANFKHLGTFIELLNAQGKVHVLSSPRISTVNNQTALIKVGRDDFFITNVSTTTTTTGTTSNTTPNVSFNAFFSGVSLEVTPQIDECGDVTLHIHPSVSLVKDVPKNFTLNGVQQSIPLASSTVRESDNIVKARNGEMIIIGGLMEDTTHDLKEGIPWLKNLPLIGRIFSHKSTQKTKSELVILLRPIVVDNNTWSEKADEAFESIRKLNSEEVDYENKFDCQSPNCHS